MTTILLVEDSAPLRTLTQRILEGADYRVLAAGDAASALALLATRSQAIDLLLTDLSLPDGNGRELATEAVLLRPGLRVVFVSGQSSDDALQDGLIEEGHVLIEKPFRAAELVRQIRICLHAS